MQKTHHPIGYDYTKKYSDIILVKRLEGGVVYKAKKGGKYVVICDEGTMADEGEDIDDYKWITEFDSEKEQRTCLEQRYSYHGQYLFGNLVDNVEHYQGTKKVFVLGGYASAIYAEWKSKKGETILRAFPFASEPCAFWKGDRPVINRRRINFPPKAGQLFPAHESFNGSIGKALDEKYLKPLNLKRNDCWLCYLKPYTLVNRSQLISIKRKGKILKRLGIPLPDLLKVTPMNLRVSENRTEEILNEIKRSRAKYLITLGNEPLKYFISKFNPKLDNLSKIKPYGKPIDIILNRRKIKLIALAHPRQVAKDWYKIHTVWEAKIQLKNQLGQKL